MSEVQRQYAESWKALARKLIGQMLKEEQKKEEQKEAPALNALKVEYNGFTGKLVKLERTFNGATEIPVDLLGNPYHKWFYTLSVYDAEKKVTHSFYGVKLEDIKFLGGEVSFG